MTLEPNRPRFAKKTNQILYVVYPSKAFMLAKDRRAIS